MDMRYFEDWVRGRWKSHHGTGEYDRIHERAYMTACLGLAGEGGEVTELLKKQHRDGSYVRDDLVLELGDLLHYAIVIAWQNGIALEEIASANVRKLIQRDNQRQGEENKR